MSIESNEIRDHVEGALAYPVDHETVIEEIGDLKIRAPDREDSKTVRELMADIGTDGYESAEELTKALHSMLPDEYVGRKYYTDRSDEAQPQQPQSDEENQSF